MPPKAASSGQSSSSKPPKRKTDAANLPRTSEPKPQRHATYAAIKAARNIPSQPPESALKDGELDLQAFVAAHEFEIRSLEQSMATSKAQGTSRAFQQVPRGLRRRTAAHNAKRVPKRLRSRALKEMKEDNTPVVEARKRKPRTTRARIRAETAKRLGVLAARQRTKHLKRAEAVGKDPKDLEDATEMGVHVRKPRAKIRRNALNEPPTPPAKFRKRQLNKTWLPTHAWHAKRARMTDPKDPLWRFAMPLTPNEKIYRPTHRAQGQKGALVWDTSYMSTIGLFGNPVGIERVLRRVGVCEKMCSGEKGRKWRAGCRTWSGTLSHGIEEEARLMCPATVFWNPLESHKVPQDLKKMKREVFLRVHPSAFLEVFNELLRLAKTETPQLYIEDLRYEIGSIELTGPASTEVLSSILHPYSTKDTPKSKHANLFQSIKGLTNPSALPANAMLGFSVQDPRLRYPPRRPALQDDEEHEMELLETIASWPADQGIEPYRLFDRNARHKASVLPSQKLINRRRSKMNPGACLKPSSVDPPIPVILLASRSGSSTQTQGTWTLLTPWACILPIWYSTVHCPLTSGGNPRFAGLNETQQVAFERGHPWFPADFPATNAGIDWELEERRKRMRKWIRRPKSKRVAWQNLDLGAGRKGEVGDGFACDWEALFELRTPREETDQDILETTREALALGSQDVKDQAKLLQQVRNVERTTFNELLTTIEDAPDYSLLGVRIRLLSRGTVGPCARIYRLPSAQGAEPTSSDAEVPATIPPEGLSPTGLPHDLREQWLSRVPTKSNSSKDTGTQKYIPNADIEERKRLLAQELTSAPAAWPPEKPNSTTVNGTHPLVPNADDLVGFVTSGSFDLSQGRGMAIGSITVGKIIEDVRKDANEGRLCIVRSAGENVGWIAKWEAL